MTLPSQTLTENQLYVLAVLRKRGDGLTANATETAWTQGEQYSWIPEIEPENGSGKPL